MASSILRSFSNLLALSSGHSIESMKVTSLTRYPVKGLGPSSLDSVHIQASETFPDDRRFALLKTAWADEFNSDEPDWIHKEKFAVLSQIPNCSRVTNASIESSDPMAEAGENPGTILMGATTNRMKII